MLFRVTPTFQVHQNGTGFTPDVVVRTKRKSSIGLTRMIFCLGVRYIIAIVCLEKSVCNESAWVFSQSVVTSQLG